MNNEVAFILGNLNRGKPERVFDWDKAAKIIRERKPKVAAAGLSDDWEWTGGTYLSSTCVTPQLCIDYTEIIDFWKWKSETKWDAGTTWPKTALDILSEGNDAD